MLEAALDDPEINQTCYWVVKPERDILIPEASSLTVTVDVLEGGFLFFYEGTERSNVTQALVENGQPWVLGAPLHTTIDNDIIVVFQKSDNDPLSVQVPTLKLTIEMTGREYPFWEKPFVGGNEIWYYLVVNGIPALVLLIMLICLCCCVKCCCRGTCCCWFCNCKKNNHVKDLTTTAVVKAPKSAKRNRLHPSGAIKEDVSPTIAKNKKKKKSVVEVDSDISEGPIPPKPDNNRNESNRSANVAKIQLDMTN